MHGHERSKGEPRNSADIMSGNRPKTDRPKRAAPRSAFRPGQSGNPSGRRKKTDDQHRIEDAAKEYSPEALAALLDEAKHGKGAPRVTAAVALLDRAWGRPVERSETGEPGDFARMTVADYERAIADTERAIQRALGAQGPSKEAHE